MDKDKMKKHYSWLNDKYKKAVGYEKKYRNGKNKKIRESGLKDLKYEIDELEYLTENNAELFDLIIPQESSSLGRTIFWNEFFTVQYFTRDLKTTLDKIKDRINSE
tara:strand:- start:62 stop:379 length:318 start_codon:yes stop_codon:yes gene_type:complete